MNFCCFNFVSARFYEQNLEGEAEGIHTKGCLLERSHISYWQSLVTNSSISQSLCCWVFICHESRLIVVLINAIIKMNDEGF